MPDGIHVKRIYFFLSISEIFDVKLDVNVTTHNSCAPGITIIGTKSTHDSSSIVCSHGSST